MNPSSVLDVDADVWTPHPDTTEDGITAWHDAHGVVLTMQLIGHDESLYRNLSDIGWVRAHYRDSFADAGMGIIECSFTKEPGCRSVAVIGKDVGSMGSPCRYMGALAIPLKRLSIVFNLVAEERGTTGVRDTIVLEELLRSGDVRLPEIDGSPLTGWSADPYFPDFEGPPLRNRSDDAKYDSRFPDHPLSRVRKRLNELPGQVKFSSAISDAIALTGYKPWWQIW